MAIISNKITYIKIKKKTHIQQPKNNGSIQNRFWSSTPTRDRYLVSKRDVIVTLVADRNLCIKQHEKAKQQIGVPFQQKPSIV